MSEQHRKSMLRNEPVDDKASYFTTEAEPYWMQDVRLRQRLIAEQMAQIRAANELQRRSSEES